MRSGSRRAFRHPRLILGTTFPTTRISIPKYGTLADFDRLEKLGQEHGVKIILDFVVNHTSDQHPWFIESRSSRDNPKRDWYIWRDGKGPNQPPNNWESTFGGSAWQWDSKTNQYYYHYFYPQQPDLNWRNPAVASAMYGTSVWWYKRGVAGFRLDAVDTLFEDPNLKNNPVLPGKNAYGDPNMENKYNDKLPEVHDVLKGLRKAADPYGAVLIGETWTDNVSRAEAVLRLEPRRTADADGPDADQAEVLGAGIS